LHSKANMKELAGIAVQLSFNEAQKVSTYVVGMKKIEKMRSLISSQALTDCVELFQDTVTQLQSALTNLNGKGRKMSHISETRLLLSAAGTNTETCIDGLSEDHSSRNIPT
ncbi:hypothetical protein KI387_015169, partial [Taxus chinensis]